MRHVYLTYQRDPCRTITVNVHGVKTPSELSLYYDTKSHAGKAYLYRHKVVGEGHREVSLPDARRLYHIELSDLEPGTPYYFVIADKNHVLTSELRFETIPDGEFPLIFVEGGDWENTPAAEAVAEKAASCSPHAVLLGGDYPSDALMREDYRRWDEWLDRYTRTMVTPKGNLIPMVLAIGNHEVRGGFDRTKEDSPFFFHYFRQGDTGESYFSLPFGKDVRLFVLDSGHAAAHDGEQLSWLEGELEGAAGAPIKIALYHVPLFPSIRFADKDMIYRSFHGLVELCSGPRSASYLFCKQSQLGRQFWLPLFDHYGMTVAFEHHDQTLKRTKLLKKGREDPSGTLYLGDGGWGPALQYPPIQGYFHNYFAALQGKVHFFWHVEVEQDKITYQAITPSGRVIDQYCQSLKGN